MSTLDPRALEMASKLRCAADIALPSTDGFTYLNDACRALLHEAEAEAMSDWPIPREEFDRVKAGQALKALQDLLPATPTATGGR